MTSRPILLFALPVIITGCADDAPTVTVTATAQSSVMLDSPDAPIPSEFGHYRWELVEEPPNAFMATPVEATASILVTPHVRGVYVYDRWFVGQAADELTYHFVVTANGAIPRAAILGDTMTTVGAAATFDGSSSVSVEQRTLSYQWRLALRPGSSATVIAEIAPQTMTLVPDVAGSYEIELRVFDGELWSPPAMATLLAR